MKPEFIINYKDILKALYCTHISLHHFINNRNNSYICLCIIEQTVVYNTLYKTVSSGPQI